MRIILCDDHPVVMDSMALLFAAHDHEPVALVRHPADLLDAVRETRPHVCVMDPFHGDGRVGPALDAIESIAPLVDVVVITGATEVAELALGAGAAAVGSKAMGPAEIMALVEGRSAPARPTAAHARLPRPFRLSDREVEVLRSLRDGDSTARVAERLGISHHTARSHVQAVLEKVGVSSRSAAVAVAVAHGIVDPPR